ncbi:hypothetical protein FRC20_008053 [Serendipita sp. 405]|nr:hypothetical protein FRC20_008053 [Serendipita sp. 405]
MTAHPIEEYTSSSSWALIEHLFSPYAKETLANLVDFVHNEIEPARKVWEAQLPNDPVQRWKTIIPITEELKVKARKRGLWNLFLSKKHYPEHGVDLTNLEARDAFTIYSFFSYQLF